MFKFLSRAGVVAGLVSFAKSPKGQQLIRQAKTYAADPENRRKAAEMVNKVRKPR